MKRTMVLLTVLALAAQAALASGAGEGAAAGKVKIIFWDRLADVRTRWFETKIAEFQEKFPNIEVEFTAVPGQEWAAKITPAVQTQTGPDLAYQFHPYDFRDLGVLETYPTEYFDEAFLRKNTGAYWDYFTINGGVYGWPFAWYTGIVYYNKALWAEAGLTANDIPATYEQWVAVAKRLTKRDAEGRLVQAGLVNERIWVPYLYQMGGHFQNEAGTASTLDSQTAQKAMQMQLDLIQVHRVNEPGFPGMADAFSTGVAGMAYSYGWVGPYVTDRNPDIDWDVFPLPAAPGRLGRVYGESTNDGGLNVFKKSSRTPEQTKAVWEFVRFLVGNDENLIQLALLHGGLTLRPDLNADARFQESKVTRALAQKMPDTVYYYDLVLEAIRGVDAVMAETAAGNTQLATGLQDVVRRHNEALKSGMWRFSEWAGLRALGAAR